MRYKPDLDALILGALCDGPRHGYLIVQSIKEGSKGALRLGDNQIYPKLHRLEESGFVAAEWQPQGGKPPRKVYSLTESGKRQLDQYRQEWTEYAANYTAMLGIPGGQHA